MYVGLGDGWKPRMLAGSSSASAVDMARTMKYACLGHSVAIP